MKEGNTWERRSVKGCERGREREREREGEGERDN